MPSNWKVTANYIGEKKLFAVYRLKNTLQTDHSGNREFATGYVEDRREAADIAEKLNKGADPSYT